MTGEGPALTRARFDRCEAFCWRPKMAAVDVDDAAARENRPKVPAPPEGSTVNVRTPAKSPSVDGAPEKVRRSVPTRDDVPSGIGSPRPRSHPRMPGRMSCSPGAIEMRANPDPPPFDAVYVRRTSTGCGSRDAIVTSEV